MNDRERRLVNSLILEVMELSLQIQEFKEHRGAPCSVCEENKGCNEPIS